MYNPFLGRWFQRDPQNQLINPYIYCANNPVMFTDPDGEFFFSLFLGPIGALLDAACWGAVIGGASYTLNVAMSPGGFDNWNWGDFGKSVGFGALSGAATFGVGQMFGSTGNLLLELGRGLTHGAVQGGISALQGGDFWTGFASGALGSFASSGYQALGLGASLGKGGMYAFGALSGGVGAWATGGNFWQGAASGLMIAGLNHAQSTLEFYKDNNTAFRAMQDHTKRTGNEIAGTSAINGDGVSGILVENNPNNTPDGSYFNWKEDSTGKRFVYDGIFRRYEIGDQHYHTHPTWDSMQNVSNRDIIMQGKWGATPLNILYSNRVYILTYINDDYGWYYKNTKIKF